MNLRNMEIGPGKIVRYVGLGILAIVLLCAGFGSFVTVDGGYVGVKKTFGAVDPQELEQGLNFKMPFVQGVTHIDTRLKSYEVTASAASKDLQTVTTVISVQHSIVPAMAAETLQGIGDLGAVDATIIAQAIPESLKAITAKYTAEELVTRREVVKQQVTDAIKAYTSSTLESKGLKGALHIANVAIKDFDFSKEFNASIEAKVKAEQEALKAINEKTRRTTDAEAAKAEKELAAQAEAFRIEKESMARAAAIKREAEALALNPNLVQLRAVEKWNGQLPQFSGGQSPVPFINVNPGQQK